MPYQPLESFRNVEETQKLVCADCAEVFDFTPGEQRFFKEKGFTNPRRCKPCRVKKRNNKKNNDNTTPEIGA